MTTNNNILINRTDDLDFYKELFPAAVPVVCSNADREIPFLNKIKNTYMSVFFLIYYPMGTLQPNEQLVEKPFYLFLVKNEYWFDKYVDFFFNSNGDEESNIRNKKIKCFGSVKILMEDEDKEKQFGKYKDAIALAFKDGSPFRKNEEVVTYIYNKKNLVKTDNFFRWTFEA